MGYGILFLTTMAHHIHPELQATRYKSDYEKSLEMRIAHFKFRIMELVQDLDGLANYDEKITRYKYAYLGNFRAKVRRYCSRQLKERMSKIDAELENIHYK